VKIRFANCTFDTAARQLFRGGREIHLSPKAFELLRTLIDHRPQALSKAELLEHVWPGVFVSDDSLARVVSEVRKGVGEPDVIRTVHAFGYALGATVEEAEPSARAREAGATTCWIIWRDRTFPLRDGEHLVGREPSMSVCLDSPKVSRQHARVVVSSGRATIEDLQSKNGTVVRGERISGPVMLESGDEIQIGPFTLSVRVVDGQFSTETEIRTAPPKK